MRLTCNINSRGKAARLIYGLALVILGILLLVFWVAPDGHWWKWIVSGLCLLGGAFAIFEARAGWCVMRAMGFKTPL